MTIRKIVGVNYRKLIWHSFWENYQLPELDESDLFPPAFTTQPLFTESLCLPPYEEPSDHDDATPLFSLVRYLNPSTILELGTARGATVANLCAISNAKVYTVNALPEQISGKYITYALKKEEIGSVYKKHGYANRVIQVYENTKNMIITDYIPFRSIDLAIIDACHDTDFIVSDFLKILPVLHSKSIVIFHDVHPGLQAHLKDGYIACMFLRRLGYDVRHLQNTWWATWKADSSKLTTGLLQKLIMSIESLFALIRGYDTPKNALYIRWLAGSFLSKKLM